MCVGNMSAAAFPIIFTVGHSAHTLERFVSLLRGAGVTVIADVRTSPFSCHFPQFNREELHAELRRLGMSYVFLGKELGGRPHEKGLFRDGFADYERMAAEKPFAAGLDRVIEGVKKYRIALMCSERDPLDCHRCLLVGRELAKRSGVTVKHILSNGAVVTQADIEEWLLEMAGGTEADLFAPKEERLALAYGKQARKVAFSEHQPEAKGPAAAERCVDRARKW
jgi:hypothetical protein